MANQTDIENIPEKLLVERCVAFDRQYQEIFYRRFADKMFNVCLNYSDNSDEAADILQEGFIKIFTKIKQFSFDGSLEGWVRRVIVNTALEKYRKKSREIEKMNFITDYYDDDADEDLSVFSFNEIIEMVNQLPLKAQIVLKLYAIEGYSHKEIAENLNISEGTSKSQLNRSRCLLREEFKKRYGAE